MLYNTVARSEATWQGSIRTSCTSCARVNAALKDLSDVSAPIGFYALEAAKFYNCVHMAILQARLGESCEGQPSPQERKFNVHDTVYYPLSGSTAKHNAEGASVRGRHWRPPHRKRRSNRKVVFSKSQV